MPRGTTGINAGGGGAAAGAKSKQIQVTVSERIKFALQTVVQYAAAANENKLGMPRVLTGLVLSKFNWSSTAGHVVEALFQSAGIKVSSDGKTLSRGEEEPLQWRKPAAKHGSVRPAEERRSTLDDLNDADLEHDPHLVRTGGAAAAHEAAAAARPEAAPRTLQLVKAEAGDKCKRGAGSGWGNVPRPLTECCLAEQTSLDALVAIGQEHAHSCGLPLRRVDGGEAPYYSSHTMGYVNVCRFTCANGCSYNWSSAAPLPGPPIPAAEPSEPDTSPADGDGDGGDAAVLPRRGTRRRDTGMSSGAAGPSAGPADSVPERDAPDSASKAREAREPSRKRPTRRQGGMFSE